MPGTATSSRDVLTENLLQALDVVRGNRMRSGLLILGVAIGITTILAIVTVMSGLVKKINRDMASANRPYLIVNKYDLFVGGEELEELRKRENFVPEDVHALESLCDACDKVAYLVARSEPFVLHRKDQRTSPLEVDGSSHTLPDIFSLTVEEGRFFNETEVAHRDRVVVLGYGPAQDLFAHENPIGKYVRLENHRYKVVGTFANRKHFIGAISNNFAVIPYTTFRKDFQTKHDEPSLVANFRDGYTLEETKDQIANVMRVQRGLRPGEEDNFVVITSVAFLDMVGQVTFAIAGVLVIMASIGLVVGGIGVMNIMLISVAERTREIGVRMALGARRRDIVQQFLIESATLTGIGGIVGTLFGTLLAYLISGVIRFPFQFSIVWTIVAVFFSAAIGLVFGIYPAQRAARLDPVEALRYE